MTTPNETALGGPTKPELEEIRQLLLGQHITRDHGVLLESGNIDVVLTVRPDEKSHRFDVRIVAIRHEDCRRLQLDGLSLGLQGEQSTARSRLTPAKAIAFEGLSADDKYELIVEGEGAERRVACTAAASACVEPVLVSSAAAVSVSKVSLPSSQNVIEVSFARSRPREVAASDMLELLAQQASEAKVCADRPDGLEVTEYPPMVGAMPGLSVDAKVAFCLMRQGLSKPPVVAWKQVSADGKAVLREGRVVLAETAPRSGVWLGELALLGGAADGLQYELEPS